jgi:hypothetical protein
MVERNTDSVFTEKTPIVHTLQKILSKTYWVYMIIISGMNYVIYNVLVFWLLILPFINYYITIMIFKVVGFFENKDFTTIDPHSSGIFNSFSTAQEVAFLVVILYYIALLYAAMRSNKWKY